MKNNFDSRLKILLVAVGVVIVGVVAAALLLDQKTIVPTASAGSLTSDSNAYDFGNISIQGGVVSHGFQLKNDGDQGLELSDLSTSCMCTKAVLTVAGQSSPVFGLHNNPLFWRQTLGPGQTADLAVRFDPLAHGPDAIGPVTRTVKMMVNKSAWKTFTITANVVR